MKKSYLRMSQAVIMVTALTLTPPSTAGVSVEFSFGLWPPGFSVNVDVDLNSVLEGLMKIGRGIARLFGLWNEPKEVVYGKYEKSERPSGMRNVAAVSSLSPRVASSVPKKPANRPPPPPPPPMIVKYTPDDFHRGDVLRLMYGEILLGDSRIPLYGACSVVIEDGIHGRPDGAMSFDGCGFDGYALYHPLGTPRGQQLTVWVQGEADPVLVVNRTEDTIIILEQNTEAGESARRVLFGG